MANMTDHAEHFFHSFEEVPFCEADSLIFTWLVYFKLRDEDAYHTPDGGVEIRDLLRAEDFDALVRTLVSAEESIRLLKAAAASPRYRHVQVKLFAQETDVNENKQFAAVTYAYAPGRYYVAFRGTDGTFVGWKEDMELSLEMPVASQRRAADYLRYVMTALDGRVIVGGHSKGGNLAVFAAANVPPEMQNRIDIVYSHDGPGFLQEDLEMPGFQAIRGKVVKTLPQSSLFGLIFDQECEYDIIASHSVGIMQHNPFNWLIEDGNLVRRDTLAPDARYTLVRVNSWVASMTPVDRRRFINGLFGVLEASGETELDDFVQHLPQHLPAVIAAVNDMDKDTQQFMLHTLKLLVMGDGSESILNQLKEKIIPKLPFHWRSETETHEGE